MFSNAHYAQLTQIAIYSQLVAVLDDLKDEKAECHSCEMGKTLVWTEETGKVWLSVRRFPYISVNATVKVTPLWQEYMEDRKRTGIAGFFFDEEEDLCEFRVYTMGDRMAAAREMQILNHFRLNWRQIKEDRRLALAMGLHSRLGAGSPIALLEDCILQAIAKLL